MTKMIDVTGTCHCGAISIAALVEDTRMIACHCSDCQQFSGAPFRAVVIASGDHVQLTGTPREYAKTADSGNIRLQGFCGECGTQLYAADQDKSIFNIRTGWLDQHHELVPKVHIFGSSSPRWLADIADHNWLTAGPGSAPFTPSSDA